MYASGYPQTRQISVVRIPRRKDFRITLKYVASRNFAKFAHVKCRVRIKYDQDQWYHDQDRSPDDIRLDQMLELFH